MKIIKNLDTWITVKHGEIEFYLTQFHTGHGRFQSHLHNVDTVTRSNCTHCEHEKEDTYQTFFVCNKRKTDVSYKA